MQMWSTTPDRLSSLTICDTCKQGVERRLDWLLGPDDRLRSEEKAADFVNGCGDLIVDSKLMGSAFKAAFIQLQYLFCQACSQKTLRHKVVLQAKSQLRQKSLKHLHSLTTPHL
jgi:hypothetical protein